MTSRRWLPPVVWAAFILVLTTIPAPAQAPGGIPHLDKVAHLMLYAGLGWLTGRALRTRQALPLALGLVAIGVFGAFDEWHQELFNRTPDFVDWIADMIGASLGLVVASRGGAVEPAA